MKGKWDNLFTYQPGDTRTGQLENNTTKNLLKILQDTDLDILQTFLSEIFESTNWPDAERINTKSVSIERETQLNKLEIDDHNKFLLGISRRNVSEETSPEEDKNNRIDGTITFSADGERFAVAIEVKTQRDSLGENQLKRYSKAIFGDDASIEDLENKDVLKKIDWWDVFGVFRDLLLDRLSGNIDIPISSHNEVRKIKKDEYLLNEFIRYLEHEQLETIIARTGDENIKRLRMFRQQESDGKWPEGQLMINLTWEEDDGSKISKIGPQPAKNFEHLLWQVGREGKQQEEEFDSRYSGSQQESTRQDMVDSMSKKEREIRADIFCAGADGKNVDYCSLLGWADETMPLFQDGSANKIASTRMDDGNFDQSNKYRKVYLQHKNGHLHFKLKHYSEKNNPSPQTPPILSATEFEKLFECIDPNIRKKVFVEPELDRLWELRLSGDL